MTSKSAFDDTVVQNKVMNHDLCQLMEFNRSTNRKPKNKKVINIPFNNFFKRNDNFMCIQVLVNLRNYNFIP